jgi:hypothetical protein
MKRTAVALIVLLLFSFLLAAMQLTSPFTIGSAVVEAAASPRTIIVPDDFPTIPEAVRNATAGDTVYVRAGNYTIPPYLDYGLVIGQSVSLVGEKPQETIIETTEIQNVLTGVSYGIALNDDSSISGFTITGNDQVLILLGNGRITNNIINLTAYGRYAIRAGSGTILSNIINGGREGMAIQDLATGNVGIKTETTANATISNNIMRGFGSGVWVSGVLGESKVIIINNTFANNNVGISVTANPLLLQGNDVVNSTAYGLYAMANVNASFNWWGTTDAQKIANQITTGLHTGVSVTFTPFLTEPNPQAMPVERDFAPPVFPSSVMDVPYWIVAVVTVLGTAAIIGISLLVYFKKRKR